MISAFEKPVSIPCFHHGTIIVINDELHSSQHHYNCMLSVHKS